MDGYSRVGGVLIVVHQSSIELLQDTLNFDAVVCTISNTLMTHNAYMYIICFYIQPNVNANDIEIFSLILKP